MNLRNSVSGKALLVNLWRDNPVFRQVLGICSTLAVTNLLMNTVLMCAALAFSTALSSFTISLLRAYTPKQVRMMVQVLVIAAYVIIAGFAMKAFFPEIHKLIGPYVGLIITNCILMGRCEAFAAKNPALPSFFDGLGAGLGYSLVLLPIAVVREIMGFGTLLGIVLPARDLWWHPWTIMIMPPAAFFIIGSLIWAMSARNAKQAVKQAR